MRRFPLALLLTVAAPAFGQITATRLPQDPGYPSGIMASVDSSGWVCAGSAADLPFGGQQGLWYWSPELGTVPLNPTVNFGTSIAAVSRDGGSIFVQADLFGFIGVPAFRYREGVAPLPLTVPPNEIGRVSAVSHNGDVAVGYSWLLATARATPVVWNGLQATTIPVPAGFDGGFALDVDPTGRLVSGRFDVGVGFFASSVPFAWTQSTGTTLLDVPAGFVEARATHVDGEGTRIFGTAENASGTAHCIWTPGAGVQVLPAPAVGDLRDVVAVSNDGSRMLSEIRGVIAADSRDLLLWEQGIGYTQVPLPAGQQLINIFDLSADGSTVIFNTRPIGSTDDNERFPYYWRESTGVVALHPTSALAAAVSADGNVMVGAILADDGAGPYTYPARWEVGRTTLGRRSRIGVTPNSTGARAQISAFGRSDPALNDVTLRVENLPPRVFGFFMISDELLGAPMTPAGSLGPLLLGGTLGSFLGPGQIRQSGLDGSFELGIDTGAIPRQGMFTQAMAGDIWHVQAWYRDLNGTATSNLSGSLSLAFL